MLDTDLGDRNLDLIVRPRSAIQVLFLRHTILHHRNGQRDRQGMLVVTSMRNRIWVREKWRDHHWPMLVLLLLMLQGELRYWHTSRICL